MKHLWAFLFALALSPLAVAEPMDKEALINAAAKLSACIRAGYTDENSVKKAVGTRFSDYIGAHFSKEEGDETMVVIEMRTKTNIVKGEEECESAFKKIMSLPASPKS